MAKKTPVELWTDALKSGEYKQGKGLLRRQDKGKDRFCCLGVACDVYLKAHPNSRLKWGEPDPLGTTPFGGKDTNLPETVREWLGLKDEEGKYDRSSLVSLNDDGKKSFKYIAKRIEARPKGLFSG